MIEISIQNQSMNLLPERCVWWKAQNTLLLADLHLGKIAHFRKHGIPMPLNVGELELERLSKLSAQFKPGRLLILGDLFHSTDNGEIFLFELWRAHFESLEILLIAGNHDILGEHRYRELGLKTLPQLSEDGIFFAHHPPSSNSPAINEYGMHGHVHPGIHLRGKGKQNLRLPCFWFGKQFALLPAFGTFTGLGDIPKDTTARIYAVAEKTVIEV